MSKTRPIKHSTENKTLTEGLINTKKKELKFKDYKEGDEIMSENKNEKIKMSKRLTENHVGDIIELDGRRGEVTSVFTTRIQGQEYPSIMVEFDDNPGYEEDIYGEDFKVIKSGRHANSWLHDDLNEYDLEEDAVVMYRGIKITKNGEDWDIDNQGLQWNYPGTMSLAQVKRAIDKGLDRNIWDSLTENADKLNESHVEKGFTLAYPNGDFYIGKPHDLYVLMTDFLIDWDNDKTTMTEYEAEDVASIRDNYENVFYAALEGGNYWEGQDFEETFGRFSDYGIANALSNSLANEENYVRGKRPILNENTEEVELYVESVSAGVSLFVNGKQYITPGTFSGPYSNNGFIYKSFSAFDENEGICYIPEYAFDSIKPVTDEIKEHLLYFIDKEELRGQHWYAVEDFGDNAYTKQDIVDLILSPEYNELLTIYGLEKNIKSAERLSEIVFEEIDWQFPETYLDEALYMNRH